jgi:hypothetical protein
MSETNVAEESNIIEILDDDEINHSKIAQDALKNYRFINNYYKEELSRTTNEKKIETIIESMRIAKEEYVKLQEKFKMSDIIIADISDTDEITISKSKQVDDTKVSEKEVSEKEDTEKEDTDKEDTDKEDTDKEDTELEEELEELEELEEKEDKEDKEEDKKSEASSKSSGYIELDTIQMMTMQLRIEEERTKQEEEKTKQEEEKTRQEEYKTKQLELRLAHGANLTNDILSGAV